MIGICKRIFLILWYFMSIFFTPHEVQSEKHVPVEVIHLGLMPLVLGRIFSGTGKMGLACCPHTRNRD